MSAAAPTLVFLAVRAVGVLMLRWLSVAHGQRLRTSLSTWDGQWLLGIAAGGYDNTPTGLVDASNVRAVETPLAFFPGYPAAVASIRLLAGIEPLLAGLTVSLLAGLVMAHGLAQLGELVPGGSRRAGLLLVGLVAAAPMGVVWSMTYSESLFGACAVWALVATLRRQWLLAGLTTALAGTVRPTSAALLLAVGGALVIAALSWRDGWRPWAAGALAPIGLVGYLAYVAWRTGSVDGWFGIQRRGWNSHFDGGIATVRFSQQVLLSGRSVLEVGTVVVLAGALVMLVVCARQALRGELPWPIVVFAAGVLAMGLGSNGLMNSKARLLLPAVTLLVPVATALARQRLATAMWILAGVTLASAWFGGYALTEWPYAI